MADQIANKEIELGVFQVFIDQQCQECGRPACQFFSRLDTKANVENALDDVYEEKIQAVVVDDVAWECYRRRKPGRAEQLKDLLQSEPFPNTAVVYRADYMDEPTLNRSGRRCYTPTRLLWDASF